MARSDRPGNAEDEPDVDFVVGAVDDGPDEDLPQPDGTRGGRRRVELGIGALALLVIVLIARAALGGNGGTPQADRTTGAAPSSTAPSSTKQPHSVAPGPTPTGPVTAPPLVMNGIIPSGEATSVPPTTLPKHVPTRRGPDPSKCPGHRCRTSATLPAQVTAAIQDAFPESSVERALTVRLRGAHRVLWYREVEVRVASELMVLRVEAPAHGQRSRAGYRRSDGEITTYYEGTIGPWHVAIQVLDQLGGRAQPAQLRRLAGDPRIVST